MGRLRQGSQPPAPRLSCRRPSSDGSACGRRGWSCPGAAAGGCASCSRLCLSLPEAVARAAHGPGLGVPRQNQKQAGLGRPREREGRKWRVSSASGSWGTWAPPSCPLHVLEAIFMCCWNQNCSQSQQTWRLPGPRGLAQGSGAHVQQRCWSQARAVTVRQEGAAWVPKPAGGHP